MQRHRIPLLLLAVLPVLGNILLVTGVLDANPVIYASWLIAHFGSSPILASPAWYDPTIGQITQPLGMLSAHDWLHGIVPWWNPDSGLGMPLAAEMQPMSFFLPFVLLLNFWHGWLALKLVLQILSGWFTYALLIELGTTRRAAVIAGALYALNATFFLVPHVMGPIPFAPLLLLGIERAANASRNSGSLGWGLIPVALAGLIYGGYPEVAYIFGILGVAWVIARFIGIGAARWRFAAKLVLATGIGLALTAPILVPFFSYVALSFLGLHEKTFAWIWVEQAGAPIEVLPFVYGKIGTFPLAPDKLVYLLTVAWNQTGGWFAPVAILLGFGSVIGRHKQRGLAITLMAFILIWEARRWGNPLATVLVNLIPELRNTDSPRFCGPALELAIFVMAGLGVDAWQREGALTQRQSRVLAGALILTLAIPVGFALQDLITWFTVNPNRLGLALAISGAEIAAAFLALVFLSRPPTRRAANLLSLLVFADLLSTATVLQLGAVRSAAVELSGVRFLQRHLGDARFYTLQPFAPNYAAAFGIASINDDALPVSRAWNDYIHRRLDPYASVTEFDGWLPRALGCRLLPHAAAMLEAGLFVRPQPTTIPPDQTAELRRNLAEYEAIGVRYVLAKPGTDPFLGKTPLPVNAATRTPLALQPGSQVSFSIPALMLHDPRIDSIDLMLGTYLGAARGPLRVSLCVGQTCTSGIGDLATAKDNADFPIQLDRPFDVPRTGKIAVTIAHLSGHAVALWLGPLDPGAPSSLTPEGAPAGTAPILEFISAISPPAAPRLVFRDRVMDIYELPHPRPFFSTNPACALKSQGINRVDADCPRPASLIRLESFAPGWHAERNGKPVPIGEVDAMIQGVSLPAGHSQIRFFYRPPGTRIAVAIALAALALWLGVSWRLHRRRREIDHDPARPVRPVDEQ